MWMRTLSMLSFVMILLLDGDIDELVYATQASFEVSDLITTEATPITEENALQVT
jgi:hypothetical protein